MTRPDPRESDDQGASVHFLQVPPAPPSMIDVWFCPECGHWAASSYLKPPGSNPDWRPRCKMKLPVRCSRPLMKPAVYQCLSFAATASR